MGNRKVDQFESIFQRASKVAYEHAPVELTSLLLVSDLEGDAAVAFERRVKAFLGVLARDDVVWTHLGTGAYEGVGGLLAQIEDQQPSVVCTYRGLGSQAWRWSTTLGKYVDVLTQETDTPVLLLPHPRAEQEQPDVFVHGLPRYGDAGTRTVMAMTDHLAGEHRLIQWAVRFTKPGGTLVLTHVEDGRSFDRFLAAIARIPAIDTDEARELIRAQLLKEPHDYVRTCAETLAQAGVDLGVEEVVTMGHQLAEYRRLVEEHEVDLLVLGTKDHEQVAMHGLAYPLLIELNQIPALLL